MTKALFIIYFLFFVILLFVGFLTSTEFLLSSQIAFFSSLLILFASFKSYKKRVLSKLDDEVYLASIKQNNEDDEVDDEIFKSKGNKQLKIQKPSLAHTNLAVAFVPFRLFAYMVLFFGFLVLQRAENLSIVGFLTGLSVMPLGVLFFGLIQRDKKKNE